MTKPQIGDTVYIFDINHRIYERDENGRSKGGPIYREHFRPYVIRGEEKRSWIVCAPNSNFTRKIVKTAFKTEAEVDDDCWQNDHRVHVANMVLYCRDTEKLRAVAKVMGYATKKPPSCPDGS